MRWRHIAPTAPDTLCEQICCTGPDNTLTTLAVSYPFTVEDPFILEHCPHIYVVGNQPEYASTILEGEFDVPII